MSCILHHRQPGGDGYCVELYKGKSTRAHRLAYALAHGLDPHTMGGVVMHSCDTPRCVNPEHLSLGTRKANAIDRDQKGRQARVLTDAQIIELRRRYIPRHRVHGASAMARELGVSQVTVSDVVTGRSFRQVKEV